MVSLKTLLCSHCFSQDFFLPLHLFFSSSSSSSFLLHTLSVIVFYLFFLSFYSYLMLKLFFLLTLYSCCLLSTCFCSYLASFFLLNLCCSFFLCRSSILFVFLLLWSLSFCETCMWELVLLPLDCSVLGSLRGACCSNFPKAACMQSPFPQGMVVPIPFRFLTDFRKHLSD